MPARCRHHQLGGPVDLVFNVENGFHRIEEYLPEGGMRNMITDHRSPINPNCADGKAKALREKVHVAEQPQRMNDVTDLAVVVNAAVVVAVVTDMLRGLN